MKNPMLEVEHLSTYYKTRTGERIYSVHDVSFSVEDGKILGIAGESGCGKSTLAMSVMGYYFPPLFYETGKIVINSNEITKATKKEICRNVLGSEISYVPQAAMNALNPTQRIIQLIEDVLHAHKISLSKKDILNLARERFEALNLPEKVLHQYAIELSGGMKQRTVIAISTLLNPKVLIADEPSSALDVSSQKVVIRLLHNLMEKGYVRSMLFITHELPLLYNVADDIVVMYAGEIVERAPVKDIVFEPIHPYSIGLMNSILVPEEKTKNQPLTAIEGTPPNLKTPPDGCRFAQRCFMASRECHSNKVQLRSVEDNRSYRCRFSTEEIRRVQNVNISR